MANAMPANGSNADDAARRVALRGAGYRCVMPACRSMDVASHSVMGHWFALCPKCHGLAVAGDISLDFLRSCATRLAAAHERFSQFEVDMLFQLARHPAGQGEQWPGYLRMLVVRLIDAGLARMVETQGGVFINGMKSNPDLLCITDEGRAWLDALGKGVAPADQD